MTYAAANRTHPNPDYCDKCRNYRWRNEPVPEGEHDKHIEEHERQVAFEQRRASMAELARISHKGLRGLPRPPKPPTRDKAIHEALSARFRSGEIFSYSYTTEGWVTWASEADWLATERHEAMAIRVEPREQQTYTPAPTLAADGHGPTTWTNAELREHLGLGTSKRLTKAELVTGLRRIADRLPAEALALLEQA